MYLILHGDLADFSRREVRIIANIARYHRKADPGDKHPQFARLPASAQRIVRIGAGLLRVADGLDRSHGSVVSSIRCRVGRKRVEIGVKSRSDAELEIWGARNKVKLLGKMLGRQISVRQKPGH
jgi:exopolyphosphatase/guanosine-5'-triphosphate,3'-diphosphate pyrophosphatase